MKIVQVLRNYFITKLRCRIFFETGKSSMLNYILLNVLLRLPMDLAIFINYFLMVKHINTIRLQQCLLSVKLGYVFINMIWIKANHSQNYSLNTIGMALRHLKFRYGTLLRNMFESIITSWLIVMHHTSDMDHMVFTYHMDHMVCYIWYGPCAMYIWYGPAHITSYFRIKN